MGAAAAGRLGFFGTPGLALPKQSVNFQPQRLSRLLRASSIEWRKLVRFVKWWLGLFCCLVLTLASQAQPADPAADRASDDATRKLALDIFKQLIQINTTDSVGSVTAAAEAMAQRFRDAGFPDSDIQVLGPAG